MNNKSTKSAPSISSELEYATTRTLLYNAIRDCQKKLAEMQLVLEEHRVAIFRYRSLLRKPMTTPEELFELFLDASALFGVIELQENIYMGRKARTL